MDDFKEGYDAGLTSGIEEAERRCIKVWVGNKEVWAVTQTDLVQIRKLVELAKKGQQS